MSEEGFELCLIGLAGSYVDGVSVTGINPFDAGVDDSHYRSLLSDATDRTTGCHTYEVGGSVGQGAGLRVDLAEGDAGGHAILSDSTN